MPFEIVWSEFDVVPQRVKQRQLQHLAVKFTGNDARGQQFVAKARIHGVTGFRTIERNTELGCPFLADDCEALPLVDGFALLVERLDADLVLLTGRHEDAALDAAAVGAERVVLHFLEARNRDLQLGPHRAGRLDVDREVRRLAGWIGFRTCKRRGARQ